jgi:hypothetical protein
MKLTWEGRRGLGLIEFIGVLLGLGLLVPVAVGIFAAVPTVSLHEIVFRFLPPLIFLSILSVVTLVSCGRLRCDQALASTVHLAALAGGSTVLLSALQFWNDGTYFTLLTPGATVLSILTFGIFPFSGGPETLERFFPAVFALGIFVILYKRQGLGRRTWLAAAVFYLLAAVLAHAFSWIAWIASASLAGPEDSRDILRLLANLQVDGYWTEGQTDRFLAPLGRQAETAIYAWQAGAYFLAALASLGWVGLKTLPWKKLLRRVAGFEPVAAFILVAVSMRLAWSVHPASSGAANLTALAIFAFSVFAWILWRRFRQDAAALTRHETEHPEYPLPSGAIAPHEFEFLIHALLALALYGAALLGWQVFVGVAAATFAVWLFSACAWDQTPQLKFFGLVLIYASLAWAGLAFGTRSGMVFPDFIYFLLGLAVLLGALEFVRGRAKTDSGRWLAGYAGFVILAALGVAREPEVWAPGLIALLVAVYLFIKNAPSARKYGLWPLYFMAGLFALIGLFLPKILLS